MDTSNWISVGAAVLALLSLAVNLVWASKRDLTNWKRTTITKAVANLLELSRQRSDVIKRWTDDTDQQAREETANDLYRTIQTEYNQILICAPFTELERCAKEIYLAHGQSVAELWQVRDAHMEYVDSERETVQNTISMVKIDLTTLHHELLRAAQSELKQKQSESLTSSTKAITPE
ncbi:hypothetical protein [Rhodococcus erythropolis]|uniref:hypothetical protein n=1 Tax=Rhodococcus erythropolis TaxID=1833 RepID=UPI0010701EFB|nr:MULTISPECIES: hypothetical protein [Rhodococcus erythropolis group]MCD2108722.1 hypothetical protein [Rhodococcus qingshengii]MCZ4527729.1 hypothetical protein [Rhodococcus erythropolis]